MAPRRREYNGHSTEGATMNISRETVVFGLLLVLLAAVAVQATERNVPLDEVPQHIKDAALEAVPGMKFLTAEVEEEHGRTLYELEGLVDGMRYEVEMTADGKVVEVEMEGDDDSEDSSDGDSSSDSEDSSDSESSDDESDDEDDPA